MKVYWLLLFFGILASEAATDYGPQVVVPNSTDLFNNASLQNRTIYRTVPLPSDCTDFITIMSHMTLPWYEEANTPGYANQFSYQGLYSVLGWWLWAETRNNGTRVTIGNTSYCINLTVVSGGYTATSAVAVAKAIINGTYGPYDLVFSPWSSGLALAIAPLYDAAGITMFTHASSSPLIYICSNPPDPSQSTFCNAATAGKRTFPHVFGILPQASQYYNPLFNYLKLIGTAKSFACFASNEAFTISLMDGSVTAAATYGFKILYQNKSLAPNVLPSEITDVVAALKRVDADVVLASPRFVAGCILFMKELRKQNYFPRALLLSQCVYDPAAIAAIGPDLKYAIDYITWHPDLHGIGYSDGISDLFPPTQNETTAQVFTRAFKNRWGIEPDWYTSASAVTQGYFVEAGYKFAGNKDPGTFLTSLNYVRKTTLYGAIGFDGFGFNAQKELILIQQQGDKPEQVGIITPLASSTNKLLYPAPTWDERIYVPISFNHPAEQVFVALAVAGLLFSVICGVWLIFHLDSPSVKAAQPPFLGLMLFGTCLLYAVIIVWTLHVNDGICVARNWLLSLGFIILYGTLVARVYRVSTVIKDASELKQNIKALSNADIVKIIGIITGIDLLILIIWTGISNKQSSIVSLDPLRASLDYTTCTMGQNDIVFICILAVYKMIIVGFGIFLSVILWRNKGIFVESRKVIFCFYNLALFAAIWVVIQNLLTDQVLLYIFRSACIFISVALTTITLFVSRMIDPGKTFSSAKTDTQVSSGTSTTLQVVEGQLKSQIADLKKQVAEMQKELDKVYKKKEKSEETEEIDDSEKERRDRIEKAAVGEFGSKTVPVDDEEATEE